MERIYKAFLNYYLLTLFQYSVETLSIQEEFPYSHARL